MSPSTHARGPSPSLRRAVRRSLTALLAAPLAALLAATFTATLAAGPALAQASDSTPVPTPPSAGLSHPCPTGSTPTQVTAPPPDRPPSTTPETPNPSITTLPDGSVLTTTCAVAPPTPLPGPQISPANTVGGPRLAAAGVIVDAPSSVPPPPTVTDVSYVISDLGTGEVLAAKDPHALLLPASTLKTLTALVTLPVLNPSTVVTASRAAVTADGTRVGLIEGNPYTVDQLFTGLVLVSGNDTAYALADAFGGQEPTVAAMNQRARDLGAWDSVAKDPSGLDEEGQQSSAYDLALFGRAVMQLPEYRRYAVMRDFTFPGGTDPKGKVYPPFQIANHNTLLESYPGTIGVKNGYTSGARHTFIGAVTRGDRTLLITQMGGVAVPSWQPTAALLDWAFANAGQLRPVGTLVAPGAPQPPEWRGEPSTPSSSPVAATTTAPTPTATPTQPTASTSAVTRPPVAAAGPTPPPSAAGGNPFPVLLTTAQTAAARPATYAVLGLALVALAAWLVARRRRRRHA
jgi:D-alanyl-D-alanine carboxypeptidase (penicillin-binding protein 5/6)